MTHPSSCPGARAPGRQRQPDSFGAVAAEWLTRDQGDNRSIDAVTRSIELNAMPLWRDRRATTITRRDVIEAIDAVVDRGVPDRRATAARLPEPPFPLGGGARDTRCKPDGVHG